MADSNKNFFPDKELEDKNAILDRKVEEIMSQINEKLDLESITKKAEEKVETINQTLIDEGLMEPDLLSSQERSYVNTLPQDYKDSTLRYLDIFRDNPDVVKDYISIVQKYGSVKAAKEAGESNILLYPNKRLKFVADNPELFSEGTVDRLTAFELQGAKSYDLAYREDEIAKAKQKEYYGKTSTKIISGLAEPVLDTGREITRWAAMLVDAVGPDNAVNALDYIENNWPRADDIQYPNKSQPFNQDSAIQELTDELTQFGIDTFLGGKIIKGFGVVAKKAFPGTVKKVVERLSNKKAKVEIDRYPMVEVHWRDIVSDSSWQSTNHLMKAQLPTCVTKGHLLSQAKGMTRIFGDFSVKANSDPEEIEEIGNTTIIPNSVVVKIKKIKT